MEIRNSRPALESAGFIVGLLLLLVNDFFLKAQFHNALTGKLSDVAGLFIFPLFLAAILPFSRTRIYLVVAAGFIFWKSSYSHPLIDSLNLVLPFHIGRVVDRSDLLALLALPFSFWYGARFTRHRFRPIGFPAWRKVAGSAIILISVFAFTATQSRDDESVSYDKQYLFNVPRHELIDSLKRTDLKNVQYLRRRLGSNGPEGEEGEFFTGSLNHKTCGWSPTAYMDIYTRGVNQSVLKLNFIHYICANPSPEHEREMLEAFEREVVDKLSGRAPITKPTK